MTDLLEAGTCGADCCTAEARPPARKDTAKKTKPLSVEIVSDAICPWCYVAKRLFDRTVARLPGDVAVSVHWEPFALNPDMPVEGMARVPARERREHSGAR